MIFKEVVFHPSTVFKKIVPTHKMVLTLNLDSQKNSDKDLTEEKADLPF